MKLAIASCRDLPDWEVDDRPFHEALRERGIDLQVAAWDDDGFDWGAHDACLLRTTWDYHLRRDAFVRWAERVESDTRLFNPSRIVAWNTHKSYLRDLDDRGVDVVPTVWLDRASSPRIAERLREHGWRAGFLKPAVGATAFGTLRFGSSDEELDRAERHAEQLVRDDEALLQPYLECVERDGERSLIFLEGRLSHGVRKVPVPGDYRVQDDFGASDEPWIPDERALWSARRVLDALDERLLYVRMDFLRDAEGRFLLSELELVEPSLFFRHGPDAPARLAEALVRRIAHD